MRAAQPPSNDYDQDGPTKNPGEGADEGGGPITPTTLDPLRDEIPEAEAIFVLDDTACTLPRLWCSINWSNSVILAAKPST
mmetsp:Transcript_26954/g.64336  ORF Transcript_26954/g.64336 Transcript_26954/m.64336 type:complete len:81 (+) Transcript_26954:57-299(+)